MSSPNAPEDSELGDTLSDGQPVRPKLGGTDPSGKPIDHSKFGDTLPSDPPASDSKLGDTRSATEPVLENVPLFDNRYRVVRKLGEGGFGRVDLVEDTLHRGERLALKVILREHLATPELQDRFRNEIVTMRGLSHPGIPQIFNDGRTQGGEFYYTMAYVEGVTLEDILKNEAPLPPDRIVRLVKQILDVLDYAHAHDVVHRDLKPQNIMILRAGKENEQVKVLDFGIAKVLKREGSFEHALTMNTSVPLGTPHYMSPEQVRGKDVDARSDLYALGIIIYRMVSGELPFSGKTLMEVLTARLDQDPTPLIGKPIPPWLSQLVMSLLARDKDKRPSTQEIHLRLDTIARGQEELKRRQVWIAAVAVVVLLCIALYVEWPQIRGLVASRSKPPEPELAAGDFRLEGPDEGAMFRDPKVRIRGRAPGVGRLAINGQTIDVGPDGVFATTIELPTGKQSIIVRDSRSSAESKPLAQRNVIIDSEGPQLEMKAENLPGQPWKEDERIVGSEKVTLTGSVSDKGQSGFDKLLVNQKEYAPNSDGTFSIVCDLPNEGENKLHFVATDHAGNETSRTIVFVRDTLNPEVVIERPADQARGAVGDKTIISGHVVEAHLMSVKMNDESISFGKNGEFEQAVEFKAGDRTFDFSAEDYAGHRSAVVSVKLVHAPPLATVKLSRPLPNQSFAASEQTIRVEGSATGDIARAEINGQNAAVTGRSFSTDLGLVEGENLIHVVVWDTLNNEIKVPDTKVTRTQPKVPPECEWISGTPLTESGQATCVLHKPTHIEFVFVKHGQSTSARGLIKIANDFYIARTEVTREQYQVFGEPDAGKPDASVSGSNPKHPVVDKTFDEARAFCHRFALRLPTENEWIWAASGEDGRAYPWGDAWQDGNANVASSSASDGAGSTAPVGTHPNDKSWCGAFDMAGNVSEWCTDETKSPKKCLRGGSWKNSSEYAMTFMPRNAGLLESNDTIGFRPVLELKP